MTPVFHGGEAAACRLPAGPEDGSAARWWSPRPVLGYRMWHLSPGAIHGAFQVWDRPVLEARCGRGYGAPHHDGWCRCGIYAFKALSRLWQPGAWRVPPGGGMVYGLVALTGAVVEHEQGYRAARAEVLAVAVAVHRGAVVVCSSNRRWIEHLFRWPERATAEAMQGGAPGARVTAGASALRRAAEYLGGEARRFEQAWTSESRSG